MADRLFSYAWLHLTLHVIYTYLPRYTVGSTTRKDVKCLAPGQRARIARLLPFIQYSTAVVVPSSALSCPFSKILSPSHCRHPTSLAIPECKAHTPILPPTGTLRRSVAQATVSLDQSKMLPQVVPSSPASLHHELLPGRPPSSNPCQYHSLTPSTKAVAVRAMHNKTR